MTAPLSDTHPEYGTLKIPIMSLNFPRHWVSRQVGNHGTGVDGIRHILRRAVCRLMLIRALGRRHVLRDSIKNETSHPTVVIEVLDVPVL